MSNMNDAKNSFFNEEPNPNYTAVDAEVIDDEKAAETDPAKKARGIKQMVAGAAVAAAGIPMMILPGPGAAAIAGGAILMGKGYQNITGKDPISEETRQDPAFQEGQKFGEEWAQRMKDYTTEEVAPAGKAMASEAAEFASNAARSAKSAAGIGVDLASKGFRAFAGDEIADKANDFAEDKLSPVAKAAGNISRGVYEAVAPVAGMAAEKGSEVADKASKKLSDKARDLMQ